MICEGCEKQVAEVLDEASHLCKECARTVFRVELVVSSTNSAATHWDVEEELVIDVTNTLRGSLAILAEVRRALEAQGYTIS